jgi:hypothetical protein
MQYFLVRIEMDSTCFARLDVVAYGAPFLRMLHSLGREIRGYLAKSGRQIKIIDPVKSPNADAKKLSIN